MKNNTSQQLHTALSLWCTEEVKTPKCCSPKPQLKLLLLHQTSPLVMIIITAAPGGKRGPVTLTEHGNRGAQSPETQFLRQAHSSWLTILISPFIHQIPHYVELLPGCFSPSQTGPGKQPDLQGGSITGRSKVEVALILLHVQNTKTTACMHTSIFL